MDFFVVVPVVTASSQNLRRAVELKVKNEGWAENENSRPLSLYEHLQKNKTDEIKFFVYKCLTQEKKTLSKTPISGQ